VSLIAIFGDVHGNLAGMYRLVERYNARHAGAIEIVLQTGDMGAFPDADHCDSATRKHAAKDPTELGFAEYVTGKREAPVPTFFTAGNHEDFDFLESHEGRCPDAAGRICCLGNGRIATVAPNVRVGALWGISASGVRRVKGDSRKYVSEAACLSLMESAPMSADILLCHDVPYSPDREWYAHGSPEVAEVIRYLQPRYVFHGHMSGDQPAWSLGSSQVFGLNQPGLVKIPGRDGGMALLDTDAWRLSGVEEKDLQDGG
jgi:Icc-related predicted phosphoesterase